MRRAVLVLVFLALSGMLSAIMLFSPLVSAGAATANTWAGVWNTNLGTFTADAGGSGTKPTFGYVGTFTGTVTGNVDSGTWTENTVPPKDGTFKITLSADGHSFTGTWAYTNAAGGDWSGTCQSGACLKNGQTTTTTTSTRTTTSSTTTAPQPPLVIIPAPSTFGQTITATWGAPGSLALIPSPVLPSSCAVTHGPRRARQAAGFFGNCMVTATLQGMSPNDLLIAGARRECWVNFTKTLFTALRNLSEKQSKAVIARVEQHLQADLVSIQLGLTPETPVATALAACLAFVDAMATVFKGQVKAQMAQASCPVMQPIKLSLSGSGSKMRLQSFQVDSSNTSQPLNVSCTRQAGSLTVSVASRNKRTSLQSIVGSRLRLMVVRSRNDAPGGQLSVTFHSR